MRNILFLLLFDLDILFNFQSILYEAIVISILALCMLFFQVRTPLPAGLDNSFRQL